MHSAPCFFTILGAEYLLCKYNDSKELDLQLGPETFLSATFGFLNHRLTTWDKTSRCGEQHRLYFVSYGLKVERMISA